MKFTTNHKPWNKGVKGLHLSPSTEFRPNQYVGDNHPSWKGGITNSKMDCRLAWVGNNKRVRIPRQKYIEHYGSIPEGFVIIHLDGDRYNDYISNLMAISRKDNLKRNRDVSRN